MFLSTDTSQQAHFASVPTITHSRNSFSVAKRHTTTMQFDKLYPLYYRYIYPGDTLSVSINAMARLGTQVGTLYDDLYIDAHAWYCPFRIAHENEGWARFQFNSQPTGPAQDNSALTTPGLDLSGLTTGFGFKTMYDYAQFGDPSVDLSNSTAHINNYLGRFINMTWNLNYRDQNLQDAVHVDYDFGPDDPADYKDLLPRGKRHDKFTSMLTAQQKGSPVSMSFVSTVPVVADGFMRFGVPDQSGGPITGTLRGINASGTQSMRISTAFTETTNSANANMEYTGGLLADTSLLNFTINALRTSAAVQQLLEADARSGTRDVESIQARWGVTVPDFRLNRPEYLGGATFDFDGHVVPQTSESGTTPQGHLAQFSQMLSSMQINHSFQEHGIVFVLFSARSNLTYQQGLARELSYRTRFDFYQPEFANLGEVAVLGKELYFEGDDGTEDDAPIGYQEYGYELRYQDNHVSAEMRSSYPQSRDYLHMADDYATRPTLSGAWIESQTPISRNLVVETEVADPIEITTMVKGRHVRTLPMFSIPGLMRL